jgi:hypothetical protein
MGDEFHIRGILMRATGYLKSEIIMSWRNAVFTI